MLLPDHEIRGLVTSHHVIDPYSPSLVGPASVDVRLGRCFEVFQRSQAFPVIDPRGYQPGVTRQVCPPATDGYLLYPGELALGATVETLSVPDDIAVQLNGKSSLGRLGLAVHSTAGWIDPGFQGQVTLELSCLALAPILLRPGMRVAQLSFFRMTSPAQAPYGSDGLASRYQGQRGPTTSRYHLGES